MLRFNDISEKPHLLFRFTGLTLKQFTALTARMESLWEQSEERRLTRRERKRAIGQGGKYRLAAMEDKLLFILVYYHLYPVDKIMGHIFGLHPSNVCRMKARIEPLLEDAADNSLKKFKLFPQIKKISTWRELLDVCPEIAEVVINTPKSGKRKQRAVKI